MSTTYRVLFLPLLVSLALHLILLAEPQLLMRMLSRGVQAQEAIGPMLQVSLVAPAQQAAGNPVAGGEGAGAEGRFVEYPESASSASSPTEIAEAASRANRELVTAIPALAPAPEAGHPSGAIADLQLRPVLQETSMNRESALSERTLPRQGELTYDLYWSKDRWRVGKASHRWSTDRAGHYRLSSESKTTGLFALLQPLTISDESYGQLSDRGLTPSLYVTRANDEASAEVYFDALANRIRFYSKTVPRLAHAVDGRVFDKLSFLYQLYLRPPQERIFSVMITLGYRVETYVIESVGEEEIDTGLGRLSAVHLRRTGLGPEDDHVEVWLAPAMDFLPVKLLFFNSRGQYYEQTINSVSYAAG